MKKARLLSLFLAAVMTASSLPIVGVQAASGSTSPTPYDTELLTKDYLAKSNWGGYLEVTSVDVDNTNKLLRMYNLGNHTKNAKLTLKDPKLLANTDYTLTLYARAQVAVGEDNMVLNLNKINANETVYSRGNPTYNEVKNTTPAESYKYTITTKTDAAGSVDFKFNSSARKHTRPIEIDKAVITYPDNSTKVWDFNEGVYETQNWSWITEDAAQVSVGWVADKDYIRVAAISQHDDVKTAANALNSEKAAAVTAHYNKAAAYDAGDVKLTPGKYELTFDARQSYYYSRSSQNQAEYEYEYKKLLGENGDKTTVKPARGVNLQKITTEVPGIALNNVYSWDGGLSNGTAQTTGDQYKLYQILYYQTNQPFHSNYRDIAVALIDSNGGTIETDTVTVDTAWDSYKLTFTVPEGEEYTLSDITFGGTGYAYDNDEFDISNLSLKLVEPIFTKTATPIATDILANDTPVGSTPVPAVYNGYDKNGFISAYRFKWYADSNNAALWNCDVNLFQLKLDDDYDKNYAYFVKFDIRHSVPTNSTKHIKVQLMGTDCSKGEGNTWGAGQIDLSGGSDWNSLTYMLPKEGGAKTGDLNLLVRRGTSRGTDIPVDIDNLVIWREKDGGDGILTDADDILYNENFNDSTKTYISKTGANGYIKNDNMSDTDPLATMKLYHNFDLESVRAAELAYTGLEDREDVGEGIYSFKADVRVPYFYFFNMRNNGVDTFGSDRSDEDREAFLAYNMHDLAVVFTMTNGTETKEKSVTYEKVLNPMWSTIEASVVVDEGYKISSVKVTPTFNSTFAANVADANEVIDFKNVSLKNTAVIKEGITDSNKENFLDKATEHRINASYEEIEGTGADGYITADKREWFIHEGAWQSRNPIVALTLDEEYDPTATYHVSFKLRHHVPANDRQTVQVRLMGQLLNGTTEPIENADGWNEYNEQLAPGAYSGAVKLLIRRGNDVTDIPVDIDDLKIWKTTSSGTEELYNKDFNKVDEIYIGTSEDVELLYNEQNLRLTHNFDDTFRRVTADQTAAPVTMPEIAYIELNGGNGHGEGIYTFRADLRVPYFLYYDVADLGKDNNWTESSQAQVDSYTDDNKHKVDVTFTMTDGTNTTYSTVKGEIGPTWSTIESPVIVKEGYKLTDIRITPTVGFPEEVSTLKYVLDYKNVSLSWADYPEVSVEDNENYLDGVTVYVDNALPTEIIETAPEGYLYVGQRMPGIENYEYKVAGEDKSLVDSAVANFLKFNVDCELKAGTTYYMSFDIKSEGEMCLRLKVTPKTDAAKDGSVSGYVKSIDGSDIVDNIVESYVMSGIYPGNTEYTYLGRFTPTSSSQTLQLTVDRGTSNWRYNSPLTIDNLKIWRGEGENKVYVYENDFDSEGDFEGISGNAYQTSGNPDTDYAVEHILPVSHSLYTPIDSTKIMTLTYDLNLTNDEAVEGKYSFKTMVKLAEATDKAARARVIFNYSDGTSKEHYMDITSDWNTIGISGWLERYPDLESITIEFDSDVPVMLIKPELTIFYKYTYGKPNTGIVMVLIKKMQGKMVDPWKQAGFN